MSHTPGKMFNQFTISLLIIYLAVSNGNIKNNLQEQNRMIGVDTVHDTRIDKDTKISRNLKLDNKHRGRSEYHNKKLEEGKEPDWSYSSFPKEVTAHVEQFKKNMSECLNEVQANDKRTVKQLSPKKDSPVHGECLIACVLKRNRVIDNGKINKANLIALVSKFYAKDTKLMKKLEKNVDRCIEMTVRTRDECALAAQLNECTNDLMASNKHKIIVNY